MLNLLFINHLQGVRGLLRFLRLLLPERLGQSWRRLMLLFLHYWMHSLQRQVLH